MPITPFRPNPALIHAPSMVRSPNSFVRSLRVESSGGPKPAIRVTKRPFANRPSGRERSACKRLPRLQVVGGPFAFLAAVLEVAFQPGPPSATGLEGPLKPGGVARPVVVANQYVAGVAPGVGGLAGGLKTKPCDPHHTNHPPLSINLHLNLQLPWSPVLRPNHHHRKYNITSPCDTTSVTPQRSSRTAEAFRQSSSRSGACTRKFSRKS